MDAPVYRAVATDYDGTIAHDGIVDAETLTALHELKASGMALLLVTGRQIDSLLGTFAHAHLFDRIVFENGALLYTPASGACRRLASRAPASLVAALERRGVPLAVGECVIATVEPYEHEVLSAIRELGVEWHVIFNKANVMALPAGVTKVTGLVPALAELRISLEETIGVGDAENDHVFLEMCGLAVAVANALPTLKEEADFVTAGARGAGFVELAAMLRRGTPPPRTRPTE